MKEQVKKFLPLTLGIIIAILFGAVLMIYTRPMEDLSLNLSLHPEGDDPSPEDYDEKGWTVYTFEDGIKTKLTPNGFGGYSGIEPGQTFYFSRVLEEKMDNPTLQISVVEYNIVIFLNEDVIYTDCPDLDNRIGHLSLPMHENLRDDPIVVTLPENYAGKTLTIAQSVPEYSETPSFFAHPCDVKLYCGYAYESELISETFRTAILAVMGFVAGVLLLLAFIRSRNVGTLCIALAAFLWMTSNLVQTSFFYSYFGDSLDRFTYVLRLLIAGTMLIFLVSRSGRFQKIMWWAAAVYGVSLLIYMVINIVYLETPAGILSFLHGTLQEWIAFLMLLGILILALIFWRKENRFYRCFTPLSLSMMVLYWICLLIANAPEVGKQLLLSLCSGQVTYIFYRILYPVTAATLITALLEAVRTELNRRMEKRLMKEHNELVLDSYNNLRRYSEEVMMLRHDMAKHFHALREMSNDDKISEYLTELIGQNEKIRPVVQSGNEMLDIILNSKLGTASAAGIHVEIEKVEAPEVLPLSDADLCSLVMNIMDNAITAASLCSGKNPYIRIKIHVKNDFFALVCENTADIHQIEKERKEETVPKHGLGLKVMQNITDRYDGMLDTEYGDDYYIIRVAIPLSNL